MTFSFYQSLVSQPNELDEAARLYRLTKWQRFWKLDVPSGAIGLVWNAMMSMGGGWFFLTASEAISVNNSSYTLPGIGSYIGAAISQGSLTRVFIAIVFMVAMVICVNVVLFRPPVAWAEKFRLEDSESADGTLGEGFFLDLLRRGYSEDEAHKQLKIAVDWGRYGELFDFDANSRQLKLEVVLVDEDGELRPSVPIR